MQRIIVGLAFVVMVDSAHAGPFRGVRRWSQPVASPYVEINGDMQPYTMFPPGRASIGVNPGKSAVIPDEPATMRVQVPDAAAVLVINGHKTSATGLTRTFKTPELVVGMTYHYQMSITWTKDGKVHNEDRRVEVMAGRTSIVDFTRPSAEALPPPDK